jgi:hypothetical protein
MWRMITSGDSDIRVNIESVEANDELGVANVVDEKHFAKQGATFGMPSSRAFGSETVGSVIIGTLLVIGTSLFARGFA